MSYHYQLINYNQYLYSTNIEKELLDGRDLGGLIPLAPFSTTLASYIQATWHAGGEFGSPAAATIQKLCSGL